jgi:cell wall-associated NlpC family hydrolase
VAAVVLSGCASSAPRSSGSETPSTVRSADRVEADRVEADLRASADRWEGVPHRWGGTSRRGVDCSGLVQNMYSEVFGVQVPRTTDQQSRVGTEVRRQNLQPGDLVFFRLDRKKRHVGIYLSDGEFVHASASSGVRISPLDRSYWNDRWWQARRIVSPDAGTASGAPASAPPSSRTGW